MIFVFGPFFSRCQKQSSKAMTMTWDVGYAWVLSRCFIQVSLFSGVITVSRLNIHHFDGFARKTRGFSMADSKFTGW